jgi:hypothetical protein
MASAPPPQLIESDNPKSDAIANFANLFIIAIPLP